MASEETIASLNRGEDNLRVPWRFDAPNRPEECASCRGQSSI